MSAWFSDKGLPGFANWMYVQYQEELTHANKFFNYVNERSGKVTLKAIAQMPTEWESIIEVVEATLAHEQHVTELIVITSYSIHYTKLYDVENTERVLTKALDNRIDN